MTEQTDHNARGGLTYPCGEPPERGTAREIAPGVRWIRMPLPATLEDRKSVV